MSHTPGPWRWLSASVLVGDHGKRPVVLQASSHNRIPYLSECGDNGLLVRLDPEGPNGRLIEASPDLLAACKMALTHMMNDDVPAQMYEDSLFHPETVKGALIHAIKKAEGV